MQNQLTELENKSGDYGKDSGIEVGNKQNSCEAYETNKNSEAVDISTVYPEVICIDVSPQTEQDDQVICIDLDTPPSAESMIEMIEIDQASEAEAQIPEIIEIDETSNLLKENQQGYSENEDDVLSDYERNNPVKQDSSDDELDEIASFLQQYSSPQKVISEIESEIDKLNLKKL